MPAKFGQSRKTTRAAVRPSVHDIVFAAGYYEGEGWCQMTGTSEAASIGQKDREKLEWLKERFGGSIGKVKQPHGNEFYAWHVYGSNARGFLMTIFSLLSRRRKDQIKNVLSAGKTIS